MTNTYQPVYHNNQGVFNNPRQRVWSVWYYYTSEYSSGWAISLITNSFDEAKQKANELLRNGTRMDRIIVNEIVPIDTVITPSV
ncbi:hypothetical protein RBU49_01630 [Clostridium sp. MB40-C1]|uniref:hypothetical protein n=1 Tax=Clostridium sp. MB40-C1 TaxID=3070996 RepID=UPI0027E04F02|nr:hypothetical protein [Clostridium sp. MB40-C1]WMJ80979.1 hypothetical protein RBU49_01630 [Clostridium sp. MB40-C1]